MTETFSGPIRPDLNPVDPKSIAALCRIAQIPASLVKFWETCGYGFYTHDAAGIRFDDAIANRLLHPDEVAEILLKPSGSDQVVLSHGIPFFDKLDMNFLALNNAGQVIDLEPLGQPRVVAEDLASFLDRVADDPVFYEDVLDGDASSPSGRS